MGFKETMGLLTIMSIMTIAFGPGIGILSGLIFFIVILSTE